ncbi:uroporphyrinogen-III C-methyltransferase [bacterium BMS3Abin01]|nr:uroporphyrinogen-III C-methyltransferase [bacterium BMS3Abin01]HDY69550.1 uroporphyrinogen-III C-methyltransferase [Actinomycetota bacterium]
MENKGTVYLIGAGPGDPGLFTLKGVECIKRADVVVYDYLASRQLLEYSPPEAELVYVGKKGGDHTMKQEDISRLLVEKGLAGLTVARLKGGDSFIFGRGGEEALALHEAGVPFEVVPGISSAYSVPAYAGIPVTHRGYTTDVAFITGHEDPTKAESTIKWDRISTGVGTLVFLMGVKNLDNITGNLMANGRPPETPVALIRWGTTTRQETITGTLADIVGKVKESGFRAPAITVVGEVVRLREQLHWFEDRPLFGKRVVVTRSRSQASDLVRSLEELGAAPVEFPTIRVVEPADGYQALDAAIDRIRADGGPGYDWVLFTSVNGVENFFKRLNRDGDVRDLKGMRLGAIGPATAAALQRRGLRPDFVPPEYRAESVIEGMLQLGVEGRRVLIPRAKEARQILPEKLAAAGARVEVVPAYETVLDDTGADEMRDMLSAGEIDIITFTSSSTVKNFVTLLDGFDLSGLPASVTIACIGPVTAGTARDLGLRVDMVAGEYTIPGLVETLVGGQR